MCSNIISQHLQSKLFDVSDLPTSYVLRNTQNQRGWNQCRLISLRIGDNVHIVFKIIKGK